MIAVAIITAVIISEPIAALMRADAVPDSSKNEYIVLVFLVGWLMDQAIAGLPGMIA